jgi:carboxyl-terminal processing protease
MKNYALVFTFLIISSCIIGMVDQTTDLPPQPITPDKYDEAMFEWSRTWAEVMELVKDRHYRIINPEKAMTKAIDAFVNSFDPHSNYLDAQTYKSMMESTSGEFHGIGIVINNTRKARDKFLMVIETIPDGPADKIGIRAYDKIVEVDGKLLEGMTTEQATSILRGQKGTSVTIKVLREGSLDLLTFTIVRDIVKEQQSLCFYIKSKDIYYISLTMFAQNSAQQLEQLLNKTGEREPKGIILDLRNNSGGLLSSVIDIVGLFLDKGSLVAVTKDNKGEETEKYLTERDPVPYSGIPIVILINNYTASAAEILAGCLKVHADKGSQKNPLLVFLVGTSTFGKGSVQEVIPIGNDSAIKLTIALYFLPYDTVVQGVGIIPDFLVERYTPPTEQMNWITESYGRENTLENYINVTDKPVTPAKTVPPKEKEEGTRWADRVNAMLKTDNQLKEAINVLCLVHNARKNLKHVIKDRTTALAYVRQNYAGDQYELEEVHF